ncbi:arsenate reductase (azurin) small subunit [Mesorhizobium temperatum]|uniref:Arsenate reductase (Azurin) small subunit n=1 Tax=Mesorhizobium temperatum TaxID=241416 RepID=A0A271LB69_9HYPH|nr:arsenate reductase (azurin) small subunit [Mesorhizobium temperatum]PAQ05389.1 arsenate reductase (azurin) small subunit [Mesorhizobium temperatum]
MNRCNKLADVGRRQFLRGGAFAAGGMAIAVALPAQAQTKTAPGLALVEYPSKRLANLGDLKPNEPLDVSYHDSAGPDGDIVGFSTTCPHKGFPLNYNADDHSFNCSGQYSHFDADAGGQQIWGQSTANIPQYALRIDAKGEIYAEGVDELLYGRLSNVL